MHARITNDIPGSVDVVRKRERFLEINLRVVYEIKMALLSPLTNKAGEKCGWFILRYYPNFQLIEKRKLKNVLHIN